MMKSPRALEGMEKVMEKRSLFLQGRAQHGSHHGKKTRCTRLVKKEEVEAGGQSGGEDKHQGLLPSDYLAFAPQARFPPPLSDE